MKQQIVQIINQIVRMSKVYKMFLGKEYKGRKKFTSPTPGDKFEWKEQVYNIDRIVDNKLFYSIKQFKYKLEIWEGWKLEEIMSDSLKSLRKTALNSLREGKEVVLMNFKGTKLPL